jgi:Na+/H+ antiporter NhaC
MEHSFGLWFALAPPLIAIAAAIITRRVYLSLALGIGVGALIFSGWNPLMVPLVAMQWMIAELTDPFNFGIFIFTLFLGGLIAVIRMGGGMLGFAEWATRWANTPRKAQVAGWILGTFIIFIDDYFDTITVGTVMRPVTDPLRISREKLAYIVDTTAAPVAVLVPISTWAGFLVAQVRAGEEHYAAGPFAMFLMSIPFNFYAIFAIAWGFVIASTAIEYGPMRKAERRARTTGQLLAPDAKPLMSGELDELERQSQARPRVMNLVLPIAVLVLLTVFMLWYTGLQELREEVGFVAAAAEFGVFEAIRNADPVFSIVIASLVTLIYAGVVFGIQRSISLDGFFSAMETGFRAMLPALIVLALAFTIKRTVDELGLAAELAGAIGDQLTPLLLPGIAFLLAGFVAFSTGTSWGTFAIMIPLVIPLAAVQDVALVPVAIGAVIGGAVFGDHASPISDTTVISSLASACDHIDHVRTQLPYALTVGGIALVGFVVSGGAIGAGVGVWTAALLGFVVMAVLFVTIFAVAWKWLRDHPEKEGVE